MPTFPGQTATQLTVDALLKQPRMISRDLVNLTYKRFVADKVFQRGTPEMVAGGAMQYQRDESIFLDTGQDFEESTDRALWPRVGWTEEVRTAAVKEYGLEVPIAYKSIRRNNKPQLTIAERKLANNMVRFVDSLLFALLDADSDVQTSAASAVWTTAGTDIIADVAAAQGKIETQDNGYAGFEGPILVLNTLRRAALINNTVLRAALPREDTSGQIQSGMMAPFLGLGGILFSSQLLHTEAYLIDPGVSGVIADEAPDPQEGYVSYDPGDGHPPIYVQVYDEKPTRTKVLSGGRWPAMAILAPKAIVRITGVAT
jgi:hypothetical protein